MELALLVVIPLVSGYVFSKGWKKSAYQLVRDSDQSIYFKSAYYGICLTISSLIVYYFLLIIIDNLTPSLLQSPASPNKSVNEIFISFFSKKPHVSAISVYILTLILAKLFYPILNFIFIGYIKFALYFKIRYEKVTFIFGLLVNKKKLSDEKIQKLVTHKQKVLNKKAVQSLCQTLLKIRKAIKTNDFECMLIDSMLKDLPISITLQSRKTYIGFVTDTPNPEIERRYLKILPLASGYRKDDMSLELTTDYVTYYGGNHFNENNGIELEDFHIVLKAEDMLSVNLFDFDTYYELKEADKSYIKQHMPLKKRLSISK